MSRASFTCYPVVGQAPRDGGPDRRTALSQAAYMHRSRLNRHNGTYNYTALKDDLVFSLPILPEGAPDWTGKLHERFGRLDEAAERCFTQLRGFHLCADLGRDLPDGVWLDAMTDMIRLVAPKGVDLVADLCGHRPADKPAHVHILLSARVLESEGYGPLIPGMDKIIDDLHDLYCEWAGVDPTMSRIFSSPSRYGATSAFGPSAPQRRGFGGGG